MKKLLVVCVGLLLAAAPAFAQETRGTISGTVRDAQESSWRDVKVINTGTNVTQEIVTQPRILRGAAAVAEAIVFGRDGRLQDPQSHGHFPGSAGRFH
jgi:hypothetical protein